MAGKTLFSERIYFVLIKILILILELQDITIYSVLREHGTVAEKAPAAICRKVAMANEENNFEIEVWVMENKQDLIHR